MGTRIEIHVFGAADADALFAARRAIEAVDDALTIHRPSPTTALNADLMAGEPLVVTDRVLLDALVEIEIAYVLTHGLFDPAADASKRSAGWDAISFDPTTARVSASRPVALDFGGFGKGFALDRAGAALREAGIISALLSAGESSIAVIGEHPLGGAWPITIPHPTKPGDMLVELELTNEALSVSSTIGAGVAAPERAAMIRPIDGAIITNDRTTVAIEPTGARAEMMSTALLVADGDHATRLLTDPLARRFLFDFAHDAAMPAHPARMPFDERL